MDIKGIAEAYASIYEAKKSDDKPKKWHDDDGDGVSYEDGEVDGKFPDKDDSKKKKKKKDDDDEEKEVKEHHQKDVDGNVVEHEEEAIEENKNCCKECGSYEHKTKDCPQVTQEAIEIAADYFLLEGIDEEELDTIIEDVGLDDFVDFVYEERAARKARASAPSYEKVKASVDASDAAKKKAGKGEYSAAYKKKETDVTVYDDKPAKPKASAKKAKVKKTVAKVKAVKVLKPEAKPVAKKAAPKTPKEKKAGLASKIGGALKKGMERHKAARAKGKVAEKRVKEFGKGFASGVKDTVKFAGKVKKAVVGETLLALLDTLEEGAEIDKFDAVVAYLIDEQLAEDFDAANKVMVTLSESLIDEVFAEQKRLIAWGDYASQLAWKEGYQRNPEKGESENKKKYGKVRGERTPMPPRGDKRREDFERWYAANVR